MTGSWERCPTGTPGLPHRRWHHGGGGLQRCFDVRHRGDTDATASAVSSPRIPCANCREHAPQTTALIPAPAFEFCSAPPIGAEQSRLAQRALARIRYACRCGCCHVRCGNSFVCTGGRARTCACLFGLRRGSLRRRRSPCKVTCAKTASPNISWRRCCSFSCWERCCSSCRPCGPSSTSSSVRIPFSTRAPLPAA